MRKLKFRKCRRLPEKFSRRWFYQLAVSFPQCMSLKSYERGKKSQEKGWGVRKEMQRHRKSQRRRPMLLSWLPVGTWTAAPMGLRNHTQCLQETSLLLRWPPGATSLYFQRVHPHWVPTEGASGARALGQKSGGAWLSGEPSVYTKPSTKLDWKRRWPGMLCSVQKHLLCSPRDLGARVCHPFS